MVAAALLGGFQARTNGLLAGRKSVRGTAWTRVSGGGSSGSLIERGKRFSWARQAAAPAPACDGAAGGAEGQPRY